MEATEFPELDGVLDRTTVSALASLDGTVGVGRRLEDLRRAAVAGQDAGSGGFPQATGATRRRLMDEATGTVAGVADDPRPHGDRRRAQVLYYRVSGVTITDVALYAHGRRYDVGRLTNVWLTRSSTHVGTVVGVVAGVAETAMLSPLVSLASRAVLVPIVAMALLAALLLAWTATKLWPARHELWGRYDGQPVMLFSTTDEVRFGQVARALRRAIEMGSTAERTWRTLAGD